jgi:hypothetical protein
LLLYLWYMMGWDGMGWDVHVHVDVDVRFNRILMPPQLYCSVTLHWFINGWRARLFYCRLCVLPSAAGTPINNTVKDIQALVHFLRLAPFCGDEALFGRFFTRPIKNGDGAAQAMAKLQLLMKAIAVRREKRKTLEGELAPKVEVVVQVHLGAEERAAYDAIHGAVADFMAYIKKREGGAAGSAAGGGGGGGGGAMSRNSSAVLACITRLRQCCDDMRLVPSEALVRLLSSCKGPDGATNVDRLSDGTPNSSVLIHLYFFSCILFLHFCYIPFITDL